MRKIPPSYSESGLTPIEVMTSLLVLLPSLLVIIFVLATAQHMSQESRERLLALNAARSTLETIKNTSLQNVSGINPVALVPADLRNGVIAITTNPVNLVGAQIATVTVTVTWNGVKNIPRSLRLSTMRSRY